jgi:hypothetical protein
MASCFFGKTGANFLKSRLNFTPRRLFDGSLYVYLKSPDGADRMGFGLVGIRRLKAIAEPLKPCIVATTFSSLHLSFMCVCFCIHLI